MGDHHLKGRTGKDANRFTYSEKDVLDVILQAAEMAEEHIFQAAVAKEQGYYTSWYKKYAGIYSDNKEIQDAFKHMNTCFEAAQFKQALNDPKTTQLMMFSLRSRGGLKETSVTEVTGKDGKDINLAPISFITTDDEV